MKKDNRSLQQRKARSPRKTQTRAEKKAHNVEANTKRQRLQRLQLQKLLKQYAETTPKEEDHDHHSHQHTHEEDSTESPLQGQTASTEDHSQTVGTAEGETTPLAEEVHSPAPIEVAAIRSFE